MAAKKKASKRKPAAAKKAAKKAAQALMNQSEYAKHRGISQPRISKLISQGKIQAGIQMVKGRKMINPAVADAELEKNLDPINRPVAPKTAPAETQTDTGPAVQAGDEGQDGNPDRLNYNVARTATEGYKAQLKRLEFQKAMGRVVNREEVEQAIFKIVRIFRDGAFNIGPRVASKLAAETDESNIVKIINEGVAELLNGFVDSLKQV